MTASPNPALVNADDVLVDAQSSTDSSCAISTYTFNFGDGNSTSATYAYAYHYFHSTGTFTVTVTVYDKCGNSDSASVSEVVKADQPPTVSLSLSHSSSNLFGVFADASGTTDPDSTQPNEFAFYWGDGNWTYTYAPNEVAGHAYGTAGTYAVTVYVWDTAGYQSSASADITVPTSQQPEAPTNVSATSGNASAHVTWTAPTSGGTPSSYTVTSSPGGFTSTVSGNPPGTSATVNGLTNGTSYTFTVTSTNGAGSATSQPSNPVTPATTPGVPTSVTATASNASAVVSWTAPANDGGASISSYTVTSSPGGVTDTISGTPPVTNATVTGLTNGVSYTFTVAATNSVGTGSPSSPSNSVVPAATSPTITQPSFEQLIRPSTVGSSGSNTTMSLTIGWKATPGSSGSICSYGLQRSTDYGSWTSVPVSPPTSTSVIVTVSATHHYQFQVQATDCGDGMSSSWVPGESFGYNILQESNRQWSFAPKKAWQVAACTQCSGGYARYTSTKGASATLTLYAAYNVGLVFETGPTRGSAAIYVDGKLRTQVNTNAASVGYRQLLYKFGWPTFGAHTIQVVSLGTKGHPRVDVDAAVVINGP